MQERVACPVQKWLFNGCQLFHRILQAHYARPLGLHSYLTYMNAGLGFAIPYLHNGQPHDYIPDFLIRLQGDPPVHLILETKGYDELMEIKAQAAQRWSKAVNTDGRFGPWNYALARSPNEIPSII